MKNINTDNKMEAVDQLTFFCCAIIDYMIENKENAFRDKRKKLNIVFADNR